MTLAEIDALLDAKLRGTFFGESGLTAELWRSFYDNGIPEEWARALEKRIGIPVSAWPRVIHAPRVLHKSEQNATTSEMQLARRLAISRGRAPKDEFRKAIREAKPRGYTLDSLATKIGISGTLLTMYRKGTRPCPTERAAKVQQLTGWPADAKHWPGGLI